MLTNMNAGWGKPGIVIEMSLPPILPTKRELPNYKNSIPCNPSSIPVGQRYTAALKTAVNGDEDGHTSVKFLLKRNKDYD